MCSSSSPGSSSVRGIVWGMAEDFLNLMQQLKLVSNAIFMIFYSIVHFYTLFFLFFNVRAT